MFFTWRTVFLFYGAVKSNRSLIGFRVHASGRAGGFAAGWISTAGKGTRVVSRGRMGPTASSPFACSRQLPSGVLPIWRIPSLNCSFSRFPRNWLRSLAFSLFSSAAPLGTAPFDCFGPELRK